MTGKPKSNLEGTTRIVRFSWPTNGQSNSEDEQTPAWNQRIIPIAWIDGDARLLAFRPIACGIEMTFPAVERVIYDRNPLIEVVFQVRFPRFLAIETEPPSEFQKLIFKGFPIYEQRQVFQIMLSAGPAEQRPAENQAKTHAFLTADRVYTVTLASDNLAVSCSKYSKWDDFIKVVTEMLTAFCQTYRLPIFTRVGLRYVNVLNRDSLGLETRSWSELLKPHIAGDFLGPALTEEQFTSKNTILTLKLSDGDNLLMRHGLVTQVQTNKIAYLVDSDFYNEEQRNADVDSTLAVADRLHTYSGRLFKWCISDLLHEAMGPQPAR
jgi:uncharacterized protein (TIGR04255 family)